jgi:uncharacterized protein
MHLDPNSFALITGSSSGIGKAIADEMASRGINVLIVALPHTGVAEIVRSLIDRYAIRADGLEVNLTDADAPYLVHQWCKDNGYRVSILVNNAGFGNLSPFRHTTPSVLREMMAINNHALVLLTHQMIPELKRNAFAYVMNVGSLASFIPIPNKSVYAATKSFVYTFSAILKTELSGDNISVSCLCPGGTRTSEKILANARTVAGHRYFMQDAGSVAREAVVGLFRGKFRIIPGWHNRVFFILVHVLPQNCVRWILEQAFAHKEAAGSPARFIGLIFR